MSASEDIRNLFGKFDGQSQQYQEVTRDDQATESRARWPLLSSLALDETELVPDVSETVREHPASTTSPATITSPTTMTSTSTSSLDDATSIPASRFSPPRAPEPRPGPLPFLRGAAPAFRVRLGPAAPEAASPRTVDRATEPTSAPRSAGAPNPNAAVVSAAHPFPPVVTAQTSSRRALRAEDFPPPVVPVNQFKPSATPITGIEPEVDDPVLTHSGSIPSGSILGKLFAPPATQAPAAEASTEPPSRSRDLRAVFGRLIGDTSRGGAKGGGA